MEQFPTIPWLFHVRMVSAMLLFLGADIAFISHAIDMTIRHGASMMIMFGFEVLPLSYLTKSSSFFLQRLSQQSLSNIYSMSSIHDIQKPGRIAQSICFISNLPLVNHKWLITHLQTFSNC